jgi:hypothetical protein
MSLSTRSQVIIGFFLMILMAVTRGHHFATINHLPSASWAVFFLAGLYLSGKWMFPLLLAQAALMDFVSITWGDASSYCVSPAYSLLLLVYGALWLAGRWYASHHQFNWKTLLPLISSVVLVTIISTVLSGGGFYFFSGRYAEPTLIEYAHRFAIYFPRNLSNMAFYLTLATICHIAFTFAKHSTGESQQNQS